jgi:hypothetical protein
MFHRLNRTRIMGQTDVSKRGLLRRFFRERLKVMAATAYHLTTVQVDQQTGDERKEELV